MIIICNHLQTTFQILMFAICVLHNRNPNDAVPFDVVWEPYSDTGREFIRLYADQPFVMKTGVRSRTCAFWEHFEKQAALIQEQNLTGGMYLDIHCVI